MKAIAFIILASVLFIGLTFQGKAFFGMGDDMQMGDLECVNHCIDQTVVPVVTASALPVISFVLFAIVFFAEIPRLVGDSSLGMTQKKHRLTEPIRLFLLSQKLSTVLIRD